LDSRNRSGGTACSHTGTLTAPTDGSQEPFFDQAADAIAASIPRAERLTLAGQGHVADPKVVVPVVERFFTA
jgi:hypothetical protein